MFPKGISAAVVVVALACGGQVAAAEYRPDDFLGLDPAKALLSPNRLGPPTHFAPVPVEARSDALAAPRKVAAERVKIAAKPRAAHAVTHARTPTESRRGNARTKLAHRHTNPLDAQARDTRIQVWPCRSGGICQWQR